jgi:hypothetical protein
MRPFVHARLFALVVGAATCACAYAQGGVGLRADQPPALNPPPVPAPPPAPDFAAEFARRYQRAGTPRLMLFWNVELSSRVGQEWVLRDNEQRSASRSFNALKQATTGVDGSSTLTEGGDQSQSQRQREVAFGEREDPKRTTTLSERNQAQLLRAFEVKMRAGGARLVDYALAIRTASLDKGSAAGGASNRTLEAAAVRHHAELLLQVLFIPDDKAPLGYGFDVSVREVAQGTMLTSFYTRAVPPAPPAHGAYVATNKGFEYRTASTRPNGVADYGAQLAEEVMNELGPALPASVQRLR